MWWRRLLRILRRMSVGVLLGLMLTVIALVVGWLLAGDWVAGRLASYANSKFFSDRSTRLVVGRVTGSVWSDMVFERVRIDREVDGNWVSSLGAERVEARYDLIGLIRGRPDFSSVRVFSPVIELSADSTGRIVLPIGTRPGEHGGGEGLKSLTMNDITVQDGVFRFSGRLRGFEANHLFAKASLDIKGGGVDLKLDQASMELLDPIGRIEKVSGRLTIAGRTIEGKDLSMLWEGSLVAGSFHWNPADSLGGLGIDGTFDRLDLGRIRRVVEVDAIPATGVASGNLSISGIPSLFAFKADVSGMWGNHPVDTLSVAGTRNGPTVTLDNFRLLMPDYDIRQVIGTVGFEKGGHLDVKADFNHVQLDSVPLAAVNWIEGRAGGHADIRIDGFLSNDYPVDGDIALALGPTAAFGLALAGVDGRITFHEGSDAHLTGIDLRLASGGHVALDGVVHHDGGLDLALVGDTADWSQLEPVLAVPGLAGAGEATGRVTGTGERPVIDVTGRFSGVHGWGFVADSLDLARLTGPVLPKPELTGLARTRGLVAIGRKIDAVDLDFAWKEPRLTINRVDLVNADTTASSTGWVDFDPTREAMHANLVGGHLAMGRFDWIPDRDVVMTSVGDRFTLAPARWASDAGAATLSGTFDTAASRMDLTIDDIDIDLLILSGPDAAPEFGGGQLRGHLMLSGANDNPDPSGSIVLTGLRWREATVDSMAAEFTSQGERIRVARSVVRIGRGEMTAAGALDLPGSAWHVFNDFTGKKEVAWQEVDLHDLTVDGHDIDLDVWQAFEPPPEPTHGTVLAHAVLNGRLAAPSLAGNLIMTGFAQGSWLLDSLAVTGDIRPEEAQFTELVLAHDGHSARITGKLPLRLALYPFKVEQPARPMDLTVDLANADLSLLPPAQFGLAEATGDLEGKIRLTGTSGEPLIEGELTVTGGKVRPADREEVVEDLSARVVFEGDKAKLVELTARMGKEGSITGSGTLPLSTRGTGASTLTLHTRDVVVLQAGEYGVKFDGDFTIDLVSNGAGGLKPITRGSVHLDRAEIIRELNQTSAPAEPGETFDYDLKVDAPSGIFVVNSTLDMELSADVVARQTGDRFELTGTMTILRGYYTMLLRRFNIIEGTLTFNNLNAIDPDIDITAETNDSEYIITVVITGQASNPRLSFSARRPNEDDTSPLTEQQILNRLAPGSAVAQGLIAGDAAGYEQAGINVVAGSAQLLFSQVQRDLAHLVGIDEIRYDTPEAALPGEDKPLGSVTITKAAGTNIRVNYSQEIGSAGNELSVEYRLGRLLYLRGEVARRRATDLREEYGIDLRLWHEY